MKEKVVYVCRSCGHREPRWLGRCPDCGSWNTFSPSSSAQENRSDPKRSSVPLTSIKKEDRTRLDTGDEETNRVLGGGLIRGSSILIGGEPGIGKSTLMLQMAARLAGPSRILYVSGEESAGQIRMRADRLGVESDRIEVLCETNLESILQISGQVKPTLLIIDSIQTITTQGIEGAPGSVSQLRYCTQQLNEYIKEWGVALFLVGHVTKEGTIAGPKLIEHIVDTVLYFEQTGTDIRLLRAVKNRFGPTDEIGIFQMTGKGLTAVPNPATLFWEHREEDLPVGMTIAPVYEGTRVLLVEIQSLVVPAKGGISRVFSDRVDSRRVARMAAVLEKHVKLRFSDLDIYVNVAGGIRIDEVAIDLAVATALYSAKTNLPLPSLTAVAGEVSLAGEVRGIPHLDRRLRAAGDLGFARFIGPSRKSAEPTDGAEYRDVSNLKEAFRVIFGE